MPDLIDTYPGSPSSFGSKGKPIVPSDANDLSAIAKAVVVTSVAGGAVLAVLPSQNVDGDWVTFTGVSVGFVPPYRVRRVGAATTCAVASVDS